MVRILLSGGGTLGSVSPLIAIRDAVPEADYLFVGTKKGVERAFVERVGIRYRAIGSVKFRRYVSIWNVVDCIKFPFVFLQALHVVLRYRPHVILTSGSFVSVPIAYAGKLCGARIFIHQQDASLGLANRLIVKIATVITVTFESQMKAFPKHKTHWTGNPIRPMQKIHEGEKDLILILGGSLGAYGLNEALREVLPQFSERYDIIHVLGTRNFFQRLSLGPRYHAVQFLGDEYGSTIQRARVVITRAGMSTLTECGFFSKTTLLVPMPKTHQEQNARFFELHDSVLVADQYTPTTITEGLRKLLDDSEERIRLGKNLHALFPEDANQRYAKLLRAYFPHNSRIAKPTAYFVGISGIGISAMAEYCLSKGYTVLGSDLRPNAVTKKLEEKGVRIIYDHRKENMPAETELVIYSTAVPLSNEEIVEAKRRHIAVYSYKEYLGFLTKQHHTIAISGTHGKTTTTALTALILKDAGLDPTVVVGSFVPQFGNTNYSEGRSDLMVVEADEYRSDMLLLHPELAVITNIDLDHLDFYKDLNDITEHFQRFLDLLPESGIAVLNYDDERIRTLRASRHVSYGFSSDVDYRITDVRVHDGRQEFTILHEGKKLGTFTLTIPGRFNILNATVGIIVALLKGVSVKQIAESLREFKGTWRRFERLGSFHGAYVYSDYAHHPTAVAATLKAAREWFPDKKVIAVFQPHSYDRTEKLFDQFVGCFADADHVFLVDVYDVAGRDHGRTVRSQDLARAIKHASIDYVPSYDVLTKKLERISSSSVSIIIIGAGDIDAFARNLVKA